MDDQGFSLADALGGLFIVGLSVAALTQAAMVMTRGERATADDLATTSAMTRLEMGLQSILPTGEPVRARGQAVALVGDASAFRSRCDAGACTLSLAEGGRARFARGTRTWTVRTPGPGQTRLRYLDNAGALFDRWPAQGAVGRLSAIAIMDSEGEAAPLALIRLWPEQEGRCAYDPVLGDCLPAGS
jgi:hypothetical protein